ncbi:putative toxin-antitoxin system antitoxin component (TIGR02293 family) [Phyllobacterium trifolii]|uniref:Putative toxin-antitoxin system antitoxin component (TIGR02293 family) n=1 Tax=Phyllobacterium trifolii TaxID=300193 RepID=A0A839UKG8_9HYPH|nr:antitoxin Xre/MbcA/ParS toxin-binding domain-containing protein [Phyllobacterium trifolii]MBB3149370.1 putative toxin-antitoxin system antitoxin component (TIGR02293 family) [Phyllobacterium trifolii]
MAAFGRNPPDSDRAVELRRATELLGGNKVLQHSLENMLNVHEMLLQGLPISALTHLIDNLSAIHKSVVLEKVVGMGLRTFQRRRDSPWKPLNQAQSGRAWKFAMILVKATAIFGSQAAAENWMQQPASGLNQRCPIDLLATVAGVEIVEGFLERLQYDVYA